MDGEPNKKQVHPLFRACRVALGAICVKEAKNLSEENCVTAIRENPYMQYVLELHAFQRKPLFDASMMVPFRKRFPVEEVAKINEYVCTGKWPDGERSVNRNDRSDDEDNQDDDPKRPLKSLHLMCPQQASMQKSTVYYFVGFYYD